MCEAFQCLPNQAVREIENDPDHLIVRILAVRSFIAAWQSYKEHGMKHVRNNPMIQTVMETEFDVVKGELGADTREDVDG